MLTGLANYLFGVNEFSEEALENLFQETPIKGSDGDDWILVELRQPKLDNSITSPDQRSTIDAEGESLTVSQLAQLSGEQNEPDDGFAMGSSSPDEGEENDDGDNIDEENNKPMTANSYPTNDRFIQSNQCEDEMVTNQEEESDEEDEDGEDIGADEDQRDLKSGESSEPMIGDNSDAKPIETANKRRRRKSTRENNNHTGTMEGSWFVTPPPCFVSNRKSVNKVSASPLEDILIEHPSISVFHSHTSSDSESSFCPLPLDTSSTLINSQTFGEEYVPGEPGTTNADEEITMIVPINKNNNNHSSSVQLQQQILPSSRHSHSRLDSIHSVVTLAHTFVVALTHIESPQFNRFTRLTRSRAHIEPSQNNRITENTESTNSNGNDRLINAERRDDQRIRILNEHPPRATRATDLGNNERNGYLSEITNLHSMQKAVNQGSQKYLKKSFLNRQNLVKFHGNRRPTRRQRCTQRPSGYSNNRKMC